MTKKKKIILAIIAVICFGFLNYLVYLGRVSSAKEGARQEREKVISILNSQNYQVESLPYAIVEIKSIDDIEANKEFFAEALENDRVYYFENQGNTERLAVLYRPGAESIVKIKKE